MEGLRRKYWCYICQKQFQAKQEANCCINCEGSAFESIDEGAQNQNPSSFEVYNINPQTPNNTQSNSYPSYVNNAPGMMNQAFTISFEPQRLGLNVQAFSIQLPPPSINIFNSLGSQLQTLQSRLFTMLGSLRPGDGLTPATEQETERLQKIEKVEGCSICQEESTGNTEQQKGIKLKCGHQFHNNCITPWFARTNTCPYCRLKI